MSCKKMNKKLVTLAVSVALSALPLFAFAVPVISQPNIVPGATVWTLLDSIMALIWPIMAATAIIMFVIAAFLFLTSNGDPTKVASARASVIWGAVGLAVAIVSFTIPYIVRNLFVPSGF